MYICNREGERDRFPPSQALELSGFAHLRRWSAVLSAQRLYSGVSSANPIGSSIDTNPLGPKVNKWEFPKIRCPNIDLTRLVGILF